MHNNLPKEFWDRIEKIYSKEDIEIIKAGYSKEKRNPTFRVNTLKESEKKVIDLLTKKGLEIEKIPYLSNWYELKNGTEKDLWDTEFNEKGKIYIQQTASQIPVEFMNLKSGDKVLDTTAAPWSKTSQIATKLENTGEIIAVDNNAIRIDKLKFTLDKQWVENATVFKTDARDISTPFGEHLEKIGWDKEASKEYFDHILLDAPCTAEWRFNLHREKSYGFWNPTIFKKAYKLSKSILEETIPMLKVWGSLVFSTCTIAPEENEAIVHFILSNYPDMKLVPISLDSKYTRPGIKSFGKQIFRNEVVDTIRCLPSEETEGFYIAKFEKVSV